MPTDLLGPPGRCCGCWPHDGEVDVADVGGRGRWRRWTESATGSSTANSIGRCCKTSLTIEWDDFAIEAPGWQVRQAEVQQQRHCVEAACVAIPLRPRRLLGEGQEPAAPAVKREAEEDWAR
jgi:hypothetical protein